MINKNIVIEDANIGWLNLSGKPDKFNPAGGQRGFCVFLDRELAKELEEDGWNVRWRDSNDEDEPPRPHLSVTVSFKVKPPKIIMVNSISRKQTILDEESVNILDWADIENVDLVLMPYNWSINGKEGTKAYLKSAYFTITEDEFAAKYKDPDNK